MWISKRRIVMRRIVMLAVDDGGGYGGVCAVETTRTVANEYEMILLDAPLVDRKESSILPCLIR
jgi:hypothetical protein